jgi:hypothetical protein
MSHRYGWTRIDALALIVIAITLGGLLMPAWAKTEQDANLKKSTNNLKQIGLAFHNYNDTMNCLPHNGGANDADALKEVNYGWHNPNMRNSGTWATQILPFIEQDLLFRNITFQGVEPPGVPEKYPQNEFWQVTIKIYLCAERDRPGSKTKREKGCYPGIVTDFAINAFLNAPPSAYVQFNGQNANAFAKGEVKPGTNGDWAAAQSKMTIQGIQDGSSNTILVGEKALPPAMFKSNVAFENVEQIAYRNAPVPQGGDKAEVGKGGDEGIFSPGNWSLKDGKKTLTSTGTARGHVVVANPPNANQKEYPKGGGVPWMYADSELTGDADKLPPYELAWGGPFKDGVLFLWGDGKVSLLKYTQRGTANFARMLYPSDGAVVTFDD